jgi:hypothetical protein
LPGGGGQGEGLPPDSEQRDAPPSMNP